LWRLSRRGNEIAAMRCFEMQDWLTIRGASLASTATIIQGEHAWLDLSDYRDVVVWTEVKTASGTPNLSFETCASKDEELFAQAVAPYTPVHGTVKVIVVHRDTASIPLATWLRWKLTQAGGSNWDVTFRVWIAAAGGGPGR
jgi:hypothetical protein